VGSKISMPPSATLIDVKKKRHTVHEEFANKRTRMRVLQQTNIAKAI
jgi:hypothetical protein